MAISAYAVNAVKSTFEIKETDTKVQFARKVIGRALTNGALTIAASVETVVLALLTVAALPLYYLHYRSFNSLTTRTKIAGRATAEAFLGIVGWKMKESKSPVTPSKTE